MRFFTVDVSALPTTLQEVRAALARSGPVWSRPGLVRWRAAVAIVLREGATGIEVLVIRRAVREGDRWSGDAALPGGKVSASDADVVATAVRETREEVGIDLAALGAEVLGRLSDHPSSGQTRWANFSVSPVVFGLKGDPPMTLDAREVADAQWVTLGRLRPTRTRMLYWWRPYRRIPFAVPFILSRWRVDGLTIWGLTYGIVDELLVRLVA